MISLRPFNSNPEDFIRVPHKFIQDIGGYFALIADDKQNFDKINEIQLTSKQMNFALFNVDEFEFHEFISSIPTFLQFSIKELDIKVMSKIKKWSEENKIFKKREMYITEDNESCEVYKMDIADENLLHSISVGISETSSVEDLENIIVEHFQRDFSISRQFIEDYLDSFETVEETKDYIMTLFNLDESIISVIILYLEEYFKYDDFVIYFIDNYRDIKNTHCAFFAGDIFKFSNPQVIKYFLSKEILNQEEIYQNAIHMICERGLEEIAEILIQKGVDLLIINREYLTPLDSICKYLSPSFLERSMRSIPEHVDLAGYNDWKNYKDSNYGVAFPNKEDKTFKLLRSNKNESMISFLEENKQIVSSVKTLREFKKAMNW